ncbi:MAG: hypothetical protein WCD80_08980 [Desulfobaccales bacterium]
MAMVVVSCFLFPVSCFLFSVFWFLVSGFWFWCGVLCDEFSGFLPFLPWLYRHHGGIQSLKRFNQAFSF